MRHGHQRENQAVDVVVGNRQADVARQQPRHRLMMRDKVLCHRGGVDRTGLDQFAQVQAQALRVHGRASPRRRQRGPRRRRAYGPSPAAATGPDRRSLRAGRRSHGSGPGAQHGTARPCRRSGSGSQRRSGRPQRKSHASTLWRSPSRKRSARPRTTSECALAHLCRWRSRRAGWTVRPQTWARMIAGQIKRLLEMLVVPLLRVRGSQRSSTMSARQASRLCATPGALVGSRYSAPPAPAGRPRSRACRGSGRRRVRQRGRGASARCAR